MLGGTDFSQHKCVDIDRFDKVISNSCWIWLVSRCGCGDIGDPHASLASINSSFKDQRCSVADVERSDRPKPCRRIIRSTQATGAIVGCWCQASRKEVCQRYVGGLSGTVVGDLNLEGDGVAFIWSCITTGKRLHGDQVGRVVDDNGLFKVVTDSGRVHLIASGRCRDVGDRVATLTCVNGG